ncbi:MAG: helix-turn-helix domain-containing protein [Erysipelotrichaceae bacterium]|nr:helix-turn-helix domain-containing protein [Erysipelotrichaceae bacterium]MDY5251770.1 helix-turn-helix domain-containing protein [Erysipelotrichaceae bacterium]
MKSCLPSKLIILRKHFNYSQQDMAKKLHVSINEYMAFENGNAMCSMAQLEELADIFGLTFDEMLMNTVDIDLPVLEDSIEIPFLNNVEEALEDSIEEEDELVKTTRVVMNDEPKPIPTNLGDTIVAPTIDDIEDTQEEELAKTMVTKVVKDNDKLASDKVVKEANVPLSKNKNLPLIIAAAIVAVIAAAIMLWMFLFKGDAGLKNDLGKVNRVVATSQYSAFLQDDNSVKFTGNNVSLSMKDVVQISAYDQMLVGLKENGEIITSSNMDTSDFKNITMIAAGNTHIAAIDSDGKLVCKGNEAACAIDEAAQTLEKVYAGKNETFVIDASGKLYAAGSAGFVNSVNGITNVNKIATYEDAAIVLNKDGSVTTYGQTYKVDDWKGIIDAAIGKDFVVGLRNDGSVLVAGNEEYVKAQEAFTSVKYIAAYDNYFVGCDTNGTCYGYGPKNDARFVSKDVARSLNSVQNMKANISAKKVNFTWDAVQDADQYKVVINTPDNYSVNSATNSLSVDASKFENGKTYVVTITAFSDDKTLDPSEPSEFEFNYVANTSALDAPNNIKSAVNDKNVTFSWDAVNNAKKYTFEIPELGIKEEVNTNTISLEVSKFTEGVSYTIKVSATGNDNYSDSAPAEIKYTHQGVKEKLQPVNNISAAIDGNYLKVTWSSVANASSYTVSVDVDNYSETTSSQEVMIDISKFASGNNYTISVVANGSDKYENSDPRTYTYTHTIPAFTVTYQDQAGATIASSTVNKGTSITLNANITIPNYTINKYRIDAASYDPNASYTVQNDVVIKVEGACSITGSTYKNMSEGCVCPEGQSVQDGACVASE